MTINCLIVRNEFCAKVEECGGIPFAIEVLTEYPDSEVHWLSYLRQYYLQLYYYSYYIYRDEIPVFK